MTLQFILQIWQKMLPDFFSACPYMYRPRIPPPRNWPKLITKAFSALPLVYLTDPTLTYMTDVLLSMPSCFLDKFGIYPDISSQNKFSEFILKEPSQKQVENLALSTIMHVLKSDDMHVFLRQNGLDQPPQLSIRPINDQICLFQAKQIFEVLNRHKLSELFKKYHHHVEQRNFRLAQFDQLTDTPFYYGVGVMNTIFRQLEWPGFKLLPRKQNIELVQAAMKIKPIFLSQSGDSEPQMQPLGSNSSKYFIIGKYERKLKPKRINKSHRRTYK